MDSHNNLLNRNTYEPKEKKDFNAWVSSFLITSNYHYGIFDEIMNIARINCQYNMDVKDRDFKLKRLTSIGKIFNEKRIFEKWSYFIDNNLFVSNLKVGDIVYNKNLFGRQITKCEIVNTQNGLEKNPNTLVQIQQEGFYSNYPMFISIEKLCDKDGNKMNIKYYIKRKRKIYGNCK